MTRVVKLRPKVNRKVVHKRVYHGWGMETGALCGTRHGGRRSTEKWERVSCGKCLTKRRVRTSPSREPE